MFRVEQKRLNDEKSPNQSVREVALALREAMPQPVPRKVYLVVHFPQGSGVLLLLLFFNLNIPGDQANRYDYCLWSYNVWRGSAD